MPQVLVVEGLTDAAFFQELLSRLYLSDARADPESRPGRENIPRIVRGTLSNGSFLEVELAFYGGARRIPEAMRGLLTQGILNFTVAQDVNDGTPDQIVQSIRQVVYSHLGMSLSTVPIPSQRIEIEGGIITVIPMGLYQDSALATLGATHHAMEDYLIKLLLADATLRQEAPDLHLLLSELLPLIRRRNGSFNSSKELFQLLKPIVKLGFSDTGVVQSLFSKANPTILRSVLAPVLAHVQQAFGV